MQSLNEDGTNEYEMPLPDLGDLLDNLVAMLGQEQPIIVNGDSE